MLRYHEETAREELAEWPKNHQHSTAYTCRSQWSSGSMPDA